LDDSGEATHRYLWGPAVDQLLADEATAGEVTWPLTDHLGTIRDRAAYDDGLGETTIVNHILYDAFGRITEETNPADYLFYFTARPLEKKTGLQNNLNRWYDGLVGRWLSEDPTGFDAGDGNLYRYVGNRAVRITDPSGLRGRSRSSQNEAYGVGVHAYFDKQYDKALKWFDYAAKFDPDDPRVYYFRGLTLLATGERDAALRDFERGAAREHIDGNDSYRVGTSIERIRGKVRLLLEDYRRFRARAFAVDKVKSTLEKSLSYQQVRVLDAEMADRYAGYLSGILNKYNQKCLDILADNAKGFQLFANSRDFKNACAWRGWMHYARSPVQAFYETESGRIWANADFGMAEYVLSHELAHAIDARSEFSGTNDWIEAWILDIKPSTRALKGIQEARDGDSMAYWYGEAYPLGHNAAENPTEGFADFLRHVYGADSKTKEMIPHRFPNACAFLRKHGLAK